MPLLSGVGVPHPYLRYRLYGQRPPALSALWQAALRGVTILVFSKLLFAAADKEPDLLFICLAGAAMRRALQAWMGRWRCYRATLQVRNGGWEPMGTAPPTGEARRAVAGGLVDLLSKSASVLSLASLILLAALMLAKLRLVRAPRFWVLCPTIIRALCLFLLMRLIVRRLPTTLRYELMLCSMVCIMLVVEESSILNVFAGAFSSNSMVRSQSCTRRQD